MKCDECKGDGWVWFMPDGHKVECGSCQGAGQDTIEYCDTCNNTGEVDCYCGGDLCCCGKEVEPCPKCDGGALIQQAF